MRALDLGIPIGALDQSHRQPAAEALRDALEPVDHGGSALLVGLHGEPEAVPAAQRAVGEHRGHHIEGEFEPIGFLGVDGEIEAVRARFARKLARHRHQFGQNESARYGLEARMQGGELDRNAGTARGIAGVRGDGVDGMGVSREVALGIRSRARTLAEHVEGVAPRRVAPRAIERVLDCLSEHEM